jgi:tetratricopeptide (TPR) repeat protein
LFKLSILYRVLGRYEQAKNGYLKVLELFKNIYSEGHNNYGICLDELAYVH